MLYITYIHIGLGLSLCKQIVNLHGGDIGIISQEGMGSTFSFTIPFEIFTINNTNRIHDSTTNIKSARPALLVNIEEGSHHIDNLNNNNISRHKTTTNTYNATINITYPNALVVDGNIYFYLYFSI